MVLVFSYMVLAKSFDVSNLGVMQHGLPSTGSQTKYSLTLNFQNLNAEMKRQGLSISELARRAQVSRNELNKSINASMSGQALASWKTIGKIAGALDRHPLEISTWNTVR